MSADGVIDMGEGKVVPLDIDGGKVRMAAGSQEVSLGVSLVVSKFVAEVAEFSVIVASGSAIRSVYGLSMSNSPFQTPTLFTPSVLMCPLRPPRNHVGSRLPFAHTSLTSLLRTLSDPVTS
jgi:hypothetical protein